ncbi:MAG: hypothetical protein JXP36_03620 [Bacteroidales bacterium]|nr:hypothetical protein [Bacteroidales bacterium]
MKINLLVLALCALSFVSCENNYDSEEPKFDKDQAIIEIKSALSSWASASQVKNSTQMYQLSYDGGNFEGMTEHCQVQWERGLTLYYKFCSVVVTDIFDQNYAELEGIVDMVQGVTGYNYRFNFVASAKLVDDTWLLDGSNFYNLISNY